MSELLDSLSERLGNSVTENCSASQCAIDFDSFPSHFKTAEKIAIDVDDAVEKEKIAVHLTLVQTEPERDTFFPALDEGEWRQSRVQERLWIDRECFPLLSGLIFRWYY